jgi:aspartate/methionine/tyrosine aminotransferase
MTSMNKVFADLPVTIFEAMSQLARDNNAINLGQGFPDDPGPQDIRGRRFPRITSAGTASRSIR